MPAAIHRCSCGHLGDQHLEDLSCARCDCPGFNRKSGSRTIAQPRDANHTKRNAHAHPTRDSR